MIDPNKPVRFQDSHGRVRIVGHDGMGNYRIRYHDGTQWCTARIDENGWSVDTAIIPPVENYEIDWDEPLAFIDTGDRAWLSHRTEGYDPIFFVVAGNERYLYNTVGMALKRDGDFEITARDIMNVETNATRQRDAKARVDAKREARKREREALEANPLFGLF